MDRRDFLGNVRDYNGKGSWSVEAVQARYREYIATLSAESSRSLKPKEHREGEILWIYPVMDEVIQGIEEGDVACIALGVDFVEEDALFPFGPRLKSTTARALRRSPLTDTEGAIERAHIDDVGSGNCSSRNARIRKAAEDGWRW